MGQVRDSCVAEVERRLCQVESTMFSEETRPTSLLQSPAWNSSPFGISAHCPPPPAPSREASSLGSGSPQSCSQCAERHVSCRNPRKGAWNMDCPSTGSSACYGVSVWTWHPGEDMPQGPACLLWPAAHEPAGAGGLGPPPSTLPDPTSLKAPQMLTDSPAAWKP